MSFFFGGGQRGQQQSNVRTTESGVPLDAIARLRRMRGEGGTPLFTSDLSVFEFVLIEQMSWRPMGLVLGSSIYHVGIQYANFYQNQELEYLTQAMYTARELAMTRMEEEADVLGADGIVGVRLDVNYYEWGKSTAEFIAVGTAVKAKDGTSWRNAEGKPFTSDLSGQDFWTLLHAGYAPLGLVLGNCVYYVAPQLQQQGYAAQNMELTGPTQAFYDARELAMERMQAE